MSKPLINITRKQALWFSAFLVLYQFLTYIANDMIMPGMIHVVSSFHAPESAIATSLTAYILGGASLQLFLGPISDSYGRRSVMLIGVIIFTLFTFFIAQSDSIGQFLLARYVEGFGLCFTTVIGYATLQEIFSEMDAIRITSVLTNIASLAPLLGPLAGATFLLYFSWRGIFVLIGSLALISLWGVWRFMPEPIGAIKKDGQAIPRIPFTPKTVIKNYGQLLSNPTFMMGAFASGLLGIPCIAWIALSPIIIVTDAHLTVIHYALWQLPIFTAGLFGNGYLRQLTRQRTVKQMILRGSAITVAGLFLTWLLPMLISSHFVYLMPGLILYGFGIGVACAPLSRFILFSTPVSKGTAYAVISMMGMCEQAIGVEAASAVYAHHSNRHFGLYCAIVGIIYLVGLAWTFSLARKNVTIGEMDAEPA